MRMKLIEAEQALQKAQREADVVALDGLLHPRCVGVAMDGSIFGKSDDIESHKTGAVRILKLEQIELSLEEDGPVGVTRLVAQVEALLDGKSASARIRYTRLWSHGDGRWQVIAAALAPVA